MRSVGARKLPVSNSTSNRSAGPKPTFSILEISSKLPAPSTSASTLSTSSIAKDQQANKTSKLTEIQFKTDQHVDDLSELFDQPHVICGESVPPALKKARPSTSRQAKQLIEFFNLINKSFYTDRTEETDWVGWRLSWELPYHPSLPLLLLPYPPPPHREPVPNWS